MFGLLGAPPHPAGASVPLEPLGPLPHQGRYLSCIQIAAPTPHQGGGLFRYGVAGGSAASWAGGCFAFEPLGPPPHQVGEIFRSGITGGPAASWAGACVTFEPSGPAPHQGQDIFRSATAEAPVASGQRPLSHWVCRGPHYIKPGPPSLWSLLGPRRMRAGTSFAVGLPGLPPHQGGGLCRFGADGAATA